ncbi:hypothetical protein Tco_0644065 [Tanacetum coccineum]
MSTLAEFMIVVGAKNRPPMLDKPQYESWKSRMELYIQENGTVRLKNYEELSNKEKLQAGCDLKATNIVLQGLPPDVYALVNHHKISKDIWDRVKLFTQGTSLSKQERECRLYDEFDEFSYVKVQANTKFLNSLPPEWCKFVIDVKLARDLHTSNYDQLYAYIEQHELLPLIQHVYSPPPQSNPYRAPHRPEQYPTTYPTNLSHTQPSVPQNAYPTLTIPQQPQVELPQLDSGLEVLTFLPGDDPITYMNKAMAFFSCVYTTLSLTNNQLRSSSNLRNQATVQDGRVTIQKVQGRQGKPASIGRIQKNLLDRVSQLH